MSWSSDLMYLKDAVEELCEQQELWIDNDSPSSDELEEFNNKFEEVQSLIFEINNKLPVDN